MFKVAQLVVRARIQSRFKSVLLITTMCYCFKSAPGPPPASLPLILTLPSNGDILMLIFTSEKTGSERERGLFKVTVIPIRGRVGI